MKRVWVYVCIPKQPQRTGDRLSKMMVEAEIFGYKIVGSSMDVSSLRWRRPGLRVMLRQARKGKMDYIYIDEESLGYMDTFREEIIKKLARYGVEVLAIPFDPISRLQRVQDVMHVLWMRKKLASYGFDFRKVRREFAAQTPSKHGILLANPKMPLVRVPPKTPVCDKWEVI